MIDKAPPSEAPARPPPCCELHARRQWVADALTQAPWSLLTLHLSLVARREPPLLVACDFACVRWGLA